MEPISKIVSMSNKTHNCNSTFNFENGSILMLHYSIDINIKLIK